MHVRTTVQTSSLIIALIVVYIAIFTIEAAKQGL